MSFLLLSGALVVFMQTGFALLESGSARFKNHQIVLLKNILDTCIGSIVWFVIGFGVSEGVAKGGFIGTKYYFGSNLSSDMLGNWFFKYAFANAASTIVSGSLAERVKIHAYIMFSVFMTGLFYPLVVAWTWSNGWLGQLGFQDFAGSGVVHLSGGIAGLVGAKVIGPRLQFFLDRGQDQQHERIYQIISDKFINDEWDMQRLNQFVRQYLQRLDERAYNSHSPQ